MESQIKTALLARTATLLLFILAGGGGALESRAQEPQAQPVEKEAGEMRLRKAVGVRTYQGQDVEGENRLIAPGDSLWRILIQERGLQEKRFSQYVVIIRGLNPEIKRPDFLKVGENVFIPLRPDEIVETRDSSQTKTRTATALASGKTKDYSVKRGDHLYQILRDQLGIFDERELAVYYALTKDLNPKKKQWDFLEEGETIRLPMTREAGKIVSAQGKPAMASERASAAPLPRKAKEEALAQEPKAPTPDQAVLPRSQKTPSASAAELVPEKPSPAQTVVNPPLDYARQLPARDNLPLISRIANVLGSETQRNGEETFALADATVRVDRAAYPVIYSPKLRQRVVIDPQDNIPDSLRKKLDDPRVAAPVLPLSKGRSLQEAVGQLLSRLGYQPLPGDRPVVIQEGGIAYEAKGSWMALAPQENDKPQEILVITLTNQKGEIPDYLRAELARKGVHMEDVLLSESVAEGSTPENSAPQKIIRQTKSWPREKKELVDALLLTYGIPFGALEPHSVQLRHGLQVEKRVDRLFNLRGKRTALFFERLEPEIKSAMIEKDGWKVIELDLASLAPRELIARMLNELGDQVSYRQHRFAAGNGNAERLNISAWGFLLTSRSTFLTDREIPQPLQRFFFEKGLDIVYFQ